MEIRLRCEGRISTAGRYFYFWHYEGRTVIRCGARSTWVG